MFQMEFDENASYMNFLIDLGSADCGIFRLKNVGSKLEYVQFDNDIIPFEEILSQKEKGLLHLCGYHGDKSYNLSTQRHTIGLVYPTKMESQLDIEEGKLCAYY